MDTEKIRNQNKITKEITEQELKSYLRDLIEVGVKHGLCLGHEDSQGGFLVYRGREHDDWLSEATSEYYYNNNWKP